MLKRKIIFILLALFLSITFGFSQDMMSVTVKVTQVRTSPSFLGKILFKLNYTDRVQIIKKRSGWALVEFSGQSKQGWMSLSALTEKKLVLNSNASDIDANATGSEVSLAGKGFNSQVENEYRSLNDIDYSWVDIMETYNYEASELVLFIEEL
ncbi:MAG: SH3 domain-containing protein [Spirochaetaceae bacterium]